MKKQLRYNYDVLTYVLNFSITYVLNPYIIIAAIITIITAIAGNNGKDGKEKTAISWDKQ